MKTNDRKKIQIYAKFLEIWREITFQQETGQNDQAWGLRMGSETYSKDLYTVKKCILTVHWFPENYKIKLGSKKAKKS